MATRANALILHTTVTHFSTISMDVQLALEAGFDGLELSAPKIRNYLEAGYSEQELRNVIGKLFIPTLGFVLDVERTGEARQALLKEAITHFELAAAAGARSVQVITGPVDVESVKAFKAGKIFEGYSGVLGKDLKEQISITSENLGELGDIAKTYGLLVNFEALGWTPLNSMQLQLAVLEQADRDNLRLIVDFWHCYVSGDNPDTIAKLPSELLYGIHVCDSRPFNSGVPDEAILRDVSTGAGVLNLAEWVDAVKATGYQDWWSCELFSKRDRQADSRVVTNQLYQLMHDLILN